MGGSPARDGSSWANDWSQRCLDARDGNPHYFVHVQKERGTGCVYLATAEARPKRLETLKFLVAYAQMKHGLPRCLGVVTEPIGADDPMILRSGEGQYRRNS